MITIDFYNREISRFRPFPANPSFNPILNPVLDPTTPQAEL
jgi:hypothetical protein